MTPPPSWYFTENKEIQHSLHLKSPVGNPQAPSFPLQSFPFSKVICPLFRCLEHITSKWLCVHKSLTMFFNFLVLVSSRVFSPYLCWWLIFFSPSSQGKQATSLPESFRSTLKNLCWMLWVLRKDRVNVHTTPPGGCTCLGFEPIVAGYCIKR